MLYPFNITTSLSDVKHPVAVMATMSKEWADIEGIFQRAGNSTRPKKDGPAFNLTAFNTITRKALEDLITKKMISNKRSVSAKDVQKESGKYFRDGITHGISVRRKAYMGLTLASIYDFDNDCDTPVPFESIVRAFDTLKVKYIAYTSYSATAERQKGRVILPYKHTCGTGDIHMRMYYEVLKKINPGLTWPKTRVLDTTSEQAIRFFYLPAYPPEGGYRFFHISPYEDFLDIHALELECFKKRARHIGPVALNKNVTTTYRKNYLRSMGL